MADNITSHEYERREERIHTDLDIDGEKGEPLAHRKKVLGKKKALAPMAKKSVEANTAAGKKMPPPFMKGGKKSVPAAPASKGKKSCGCIMGTKCSHK